MEVIPRNRRNLVEKHRTAMQDLETAIPFRDNGKKLLGHTWKHKEKKPKKTHWKHSLSKVADTKQGAVAKLHEIILFRVHAE